MWLFERWNIGCLWFLLQQAALPILRRPVSRFKLKSIYRCKIQHIDSIYIYLCIYIPTNSTNLFLNQHFFVGLGCWFGYSL